MFESAKLPLLINLLKDLVLQLNSLITQKQGKTATLVSFPFIVTWEI
jgi:hypothetical protein